MNPSLQQLQAQIADTIAGWGEGEMVAPFEGRWSAAEILEHLLLTYEGTIRGFERCVETGKTLATRSSLKQRVTAFALLKTRYFPPGRKSPERVRPKGRPAAQVIGQLGAQIEKMDSAMTRCEAAFGAKVKVLDHPMLGALSVDEWRIFHCVHGKHHLRQLRKMRNLRRLTATA